MKCIIINKLNHPVVISYDGEGKVLSPGSTTSPMDPNKLGALPSGVYKKVISKK